jgi:hydroxyethylthiazole kinase-like sugar kinase family protein
MMSLLFAESTTVVQNITQTGYGVGSMLAVVCSWQRNRSILWAILAAVLTWFYVVYFALTRRADETK